MFESYLKPPISFPTLTGSIVTFNSQYAGLPLKSCVVDFQDGTGIDSLDFSATGKNLLDVSSISGTFGGVTYANDENGIVSLNGTKIGSTYAPFPNSRVSMRAGISYTFSINFLSGTIRDVNQNLRNLQCYLISTNNVNMGSIIMYETETIKSITVTPEEDIVVYPRFAWWTDNTIITDVRIQMQVEINSISTDFVKYNGVQKRFSFGKTIQSGSLNVLTGELTNNDTTPPEVINLGGMEIDALQGVNNIWADTGDTTLQYIKFG